MESQDLSESKRLENNDDENKSLPPAVHEELEAISTEEAIDKTPEVKAYYINFFSIKIHTIIKYLSGYGD